MAGDVLDFVLDGLIEALELERELGVRQIEVDRTLLGGGAVAADSAPRVPSVAPVTPVAPRAPVAPTAPAVPAPPVPRPSPAEATAAGGSLVFLHDRPLSPKGVEMMAKILAAMHRTPGNAPIVVAPPVPKAKIVVILGARAMKKYFPEMKGEPGQWIALPDGRDVLVTYSPEYILRFTTVSPAVQKLKQDMWRSLKAVVQRLGAAG